MTQPVPRQLLRRPFSTAEAAALGVGRDVLQGKRFASMYRGVWVCVDVVLELIHWLRAASLILPEDAAVSHHTRLRHLGVGIGPKRPLHFSTNTAAQTRRSGVVLHRRNGRLHPIVVDGVRMLGPDRSFVDAATTLKFVELVQAGDWLLHLERTDLATLTAYTMRAHLDGVRRARRALLVVRERVESPMETLVRLMLLFARLPEPDTNRDIFDAHGRWITRGDMPYFAYKVLVEYDGQWHDRSQKQRQRDRERREQLEADGWAVILVTSEDLKDKAEIVRRVHRALTSRGYDGRAPHFNVMWTTWFAT